MKRSSVWLLLISFGASGTLVRLLDIPFGSSDVFVLCLSVAIVFGLAGRLLRAHIGTVNWLNVIGALFGLATAIIGMLWLVSFVSPWLLFGACLVLLAIIATLTFRNPEHERELRAVSGKCIECGYDLRASYECCPECGAGLPEEIQRRRRVAAELAAAKAQRDASTPAAEAVK